MKLLMVSPHLPDPSWGAGTRSYYILKALAHEHSVSLLALTASHNVEMAHLEELGLTHIRQIVVPPSLRRKRAQQMVSVLRGKSYLLDAYNRQDVKKEIDALLSHHCYDAVLFESVFMAGYELPEGVSAIIDQHNIEYELLYRTYLREKAWSRKWYNLWESRMLKPVELERCRKAQGVLVTSEREALLLKRLLPRSPIEVVPNGVDIELFDVIDGQDEIADRIVFSGSMNYYPNIDAVLFFARACWPSIRARIPGATWYIVGKSPPPEVLSLAHLSGVTVTGEVPDIKPYLAAATVAIAPLLIGSGTRLKILEALAMSKAMVSTSLGCEGLSVVPGKHLIVADQAQTFVQNIVDLMQHREKRLALGCAGRALVEAEYSWQKCGDYTIRALEKMVR